MVQHGGMRLDMSIIPIQKRNCRGLGVGRFEIDVLTM